MVDPFYMGYIIYQLIVVLVIFFFKNPLHMLTKKPERLTYIYI